MLSYIDSLGGRVSTLLFLVTVLDRIIPRSFKTAIEKYYNTLLNYFNPYVHITFDEHPRESFYGRSKAYVAIESYLGTKNFSVQAQWLKGNVAEDERSLALSMDDFEVITDIFEGVKVSWMKVTIVPLKAISKNGDNIEKMAYVLSFRRKDSDCVVGSYLEHVLSEGEMIEKRSRGQRMYTNVKGLYAPTEMAWSFVGFEHPATFDTLAMDRMRKKDIIDDLVQFTKGKDYYKKIGKPWKRGYLLYGPPGTGKSTMIAAMANFLQYDVYDLELTAVEDNTTLRRLIMDISKRAIVVIEDIDCSLEITGKRRRSITETSDKNESDNDDKDDDKKKKSKVTLSGLLNFMDGLWSASGGERIFILTTNYKEKLDQALIRSGRMDKHIQMSYCCYEAFKVLAYNYLQIESHEKFERIRSLLSETEMSPADVAENLMPKSADMSVDGCLKCLIEALTKSKEANVEDTVTETDLGSDSNKDIGADVDMATDTDSDIVDR